MKFMCTQAGTVGHWHISPRSLIQSNIAYKQCGRHWFYQEVSTACAQRNPSICIGKLVTVSGGTQSFLAISRAHLLSQLLTAVTGHCRVLVSHYTNTNVSPTALGFRSQEGNKWGERDVEKLNQLVGG